MVFTTVMALSSLGFAAAECPAQAKTIHLCESTPQKDDSDVVAGMFDSIAVCDQGQKTLLVVEKSGASEMVEAQATSLAGGTIYTLPPMEAYELSLSVTTGILSKERPATFIVYNKAHDLKATSTYTCR